MSLFGFALLLVIAYCTSAMAEIVGIVERPLAMFGDAAIAFVGALLFGAAIEIGPQLGGVAVYPAILGAFVFASIGGLVARMFRGRRARSVA